MRDKIPFDRISILTGRIERLEEWQKEFRNVEEISQQYKERFDTLQKEISELKDQADEHIIFYDVAKKNEGSGTDWSWRVQIIDRIIDTENEIKKIKLDKTEIEKLNNLELMEYILEIINIWKKRLEK